MLSLGPPLPLCSLGCLLVWVRSRMEQDQRVCSTEEEEESFSVDLKEEFEEKEDRGPADTVNAGRVYCYSSDEDEEEEEERKPWSERLRRRPRCVPRVPVARPVLDRLDLGTFTPMMTSEPRLTSTVLSTSDRQRTMTMPSERLIHTARHLPSLKRGHGETWEGRMTKKRGKQFVQQAEVDNMGKKVVDKKVVEKRRRRASSGDEKRRVLRRRAEPSDVFKKGNEYGSLSSLDSEMLR